MMQIIWYMYMLLVGEAGKNKGMLENTLLFKTVFLKKYIVECCERTGSELFTNSCFCPLFTIKKSNFPISITFTE